MISPEFGMMCVMFKSWRGEFNITTWSANRNSFEQYGKMNFNIRLEEEDRKTSNWQYSYFLSGVKYKTITQVGHGERAEQRKSRRERDASKEWEMPNFYVLHRGEHHNIVSPYLIIGLETC